MAALAVLVLVAFETFEDVVGLDAEFGRALGRGDRSHAAAAKHERLLAGRHGVPDLFVERRIDRHAGPLLPRDRRRARKEADPFALGIAARVDQHAVALAP